MRGRWILVATCVLGAGAASAAPQGGAGGGLALQVGDTVVGYVHDASGGTLRAEVVEEEIPGAPWPEKHLGRTQATPVTLAIGLGQSKPIIDWINGVMDGMPTRRDGALLMTDAQGGTVHVREFQDALLTEISFPAMDAGAKEEGYLAISLQPETIRYEPGDKQKVEGAFGDKAGKRWLPSNFRLELGDLPCARVTKIDSFAVKQKVVRDEVGAPRDPTWLPGRLELSDMRITVEAPDAAAWSDWFQSFVVDGHSGPNEEKDGRIVFLAPDRSTELGRLELENVGIFELTPLPPEPGAGKAGDPVRVQVEVYVEHVHYLVP